MRKAVIVACSTVLCGIWFGSAASAQAPAQSTTPTPTAPTPTAPLSIVAAQPTGEVASLEQAAEIRIRFSEPMVPIGRLPDQVTAPFVTIRPAMAGTFRWAGPTLLVFTPDPARPLPTATRYDVTVATTATA